MLTIRPEDVLHRSHLYRLLIEILDRPVLLHGLAFKGGTCASMLGYLDRFSVDLDFDVLPHTDESALRAEFHQVFDTLGFTVTRHLDRALFFQLRYPNQPGRRNTLKVSASSMAVQANQYQVQYLPAIDRLANCQALPTMVANKLVALTDRHARYHTIAGRDLYDIHYFLVHGYPYHAPVLTERTGLSPLEYLAKLIAFIRDNVTQTSINEDLNTLLPPDRFQQIRKILIPETLTLLGEEVNRLAGG